MKKHSPSNDKLRQEYNKLFRECKELKKFMKSNLKRETRLTGPQLAVEYNKLLKENKELKETNKTLKGRIEDLLMRVDIMKGTEQQLWRKKEREEKVWRERQTNWKKDYEALKKQNEELKKEYQAMVEDVEPTKQKLKEALLKIVDLESQLEQQKFLTSETVQKVVNEQKMEELQQQLKEKQDIIKIQSMNNRVLLEEIMRAREGKK